jgi:hypothetical protein
VKEATSSGSSTTTNREVYHTLWQLPALSPVPNASSPSSISEAAEKEAAYRQLLVRAALAVLLPTEDLENECLTTLVGQIFSELIIGNLIANKIVEPWFLWECIIILSRISQRRNFQSLDSAAMLQEGGEGPTKATRRAWQSWHTMIWTLLRWGFLVTAFLRFVLVTLFTWRSLPPRRPDAFTTNKTSQTSPVKIPVLSFRLWSVLSQLVELDRRMPWLLGTVSMVQWIALTGPGQVAGLDSVLDR